MNIKAKFAIEKNWATTQAERTYNFGCDAALPEANSAYWRGVTIAAPPELVFRWLCQLKAAPYSYDWIDNFGRTSPRQLTPGLEQLAVGQRVMTIFKLASFEPDREITIVAGRHSWYRHLTGAGAISYLVVPDTSNPEQPPQCRLVGKVVIQYPAGPIGWFNRLWLGWGDLLMMRRQLLNLKQLAERDANLARPHSG